MAREKAQFGPSLEDGSRGDLIDKVKGDPGRIVADAANAGKPASDPKKGTWGFDALAIAESAYDDGTSFMDSSLRKRWEASERSFQSRHPTGSKYFSETYKARSKLFRPKTRAAMRQGEAQAAASFFANEDVAKVSAGDPDNMQQVAGAAILQETLKHRLTAPSTRIAIPWFLTLVGAFQDGSKNGIVISKQSWEYKAVEYDVLTEVLGEDGTPAKGEDGTPKYAKKVERKVIVDRPRCDIIPPENVLIDRGANWIDPINSSPYVVVMWPLYIDEVEQRMTDIDAKTGQPIWNKLDRGILQQAAKTQAHDSTRQQRDGKQEDSKDSQIGVEEFQIVWIHENFVRWADEEWVYYTVGKQHLLTDPIPLEEVYPHCYPGERPLTMGQIVIETNRLYPSSKAELTAGLQTMSNEIANQRIDNVKLALNKRYLVKRGTQTDLRSILRNSAGSVTLTNNPEEDVKVIETRDVTASSYQEQDRINADFDEIAGSFSVGSVATNRRLGETVGGMNLISGSANSLGELDLRVFTETWVQPVLSQIIRLIQHFETDATILGLAGKKAKIWEQYRIATIDDQLLMQDVIVKVDVGIGATDPMQRLQKFQVAAKTIKEIFGEALAPKMNDAEIVKEIMSMLGYRDGARFFNFDGPPAVVQQLQQQLQELERKLETKELDRQARVEVAQITGTSKIIAQSIDSDQRAAQDAQSGVADMQAQERQFQIDTAAHERDFQMREREHAQDMQFRNEEHQLDQREKMLDIFQKNAMGQQQIAHTREMGEIKAEQAAAGKPAGEGGTGGTKAVARRPQQQPAMPPQPAGPDPMEDIARALMLQMQATQQVVGAVQDLVEKLNAPKRIVMGPNGRPIGVETVTGQPNA